MEEIDKSEIKETKRGDSDKRENTRSTIAMIYVCAFFAIILTVFGVGCCKGYSVDEYKDMLVSVSGILSGPLGFIVGYYFKASQE